MATEPFGAVSRQPLVHLYATAPPTRGFASILAQAWTGWEQVLTVPDDDPQETRTHRSGESLLRIRRMTALRRHTKPQLREKTAAFCSRGSIPTPAQQPQLRKHSGRHRCCR
ncbi:MAG: hypothetical protein LH624_18880 [Cryobacterium sp.]|nr:hypothetical protein [Cryobacterium sp.]